MENDASPINLYECNLPSYEAKSTTLKRSSPGDDFENHTYSMEPWIAWNVTFMSKASHIILNHCVLLMLASWQGAELAFSRVQPAALATHALKDITLELMVLAPFVLSSWESSTLSINLCTWFIFVGRMQVLKNIILHNQSHTPSLVKATHNTNKPNKSNYLSIN